MSVMIFEEVRKGNKYEFFVTDYGAFKFRDKLNVPSFGDLRRLLKKVHHSTFEIYPRITKMYKT